MNSVVTENYIDFIDDFLAGQRDCLDGIPHQPGRSESYDRGYADQYEREQIEGARQ